MRFAAVFATSLATACLALAACSQPAPGTSATSSTSAATTGSPSAAPTAAPRPSPPAPTQGYLTVVCQPVCDQVNVDGRALGGSPLIRLPMAPGKHEVVARSGAKTKTETVEVVAGENTAKRIYLDEREAAAVASASALAKDEDALRAALEAKVWGNKGPASLDDLRMLRAICEKKGEVGCYDKLTKRIYEMKKQESTEP